MPLCRWSQALWRARRCLELAQPRVVEEILPGARLPFAWEQVTARPALDLHVGGATCRALRIDELTLSSSVEVPGPDGRTVEVLRYRTLADGPVRVLQVLSLRDSSLLAAVPHAPSLSSLGSFVGSDDSRPRLKLSIGLNAVGLSLISRTLFIGFTCFAGVLVPCVARVCARTRHAVRSSVLAWRAEGVAQSA